MLDFCSSAVKEKQEKLVLLFPYPAGISHKILLFKSPEMLFVGTGATGQKFFR